VRRALAWLSHSGGGNMPDPHVHQLDPYALCEGPATTMNFFFDHHYYPYHAAMSRRPRHSLLNYDKHLREALGPLSWEELTPLVLNTWLRRQVEKGLKNATINKHIFLLNRLIRTAEEWQVIPDGVRPPRCLKKLPTGDHRQRFLSQEEIRRLVSACEQIRHPFLSLFIRFLLLTGARKGEARTAKWQDIDQERGVWCVPVSKNGRSRRVMLSSAALSVLNQTREQSKALGLPDGPNDFLFTNPRSRTRYNTFHIAYFKARDIAGLQDVRIHDLRHTYASLLINNGVTLYEVQELLGHSSPAMTQRYAHLLPNQLRERTEIIGRIVGQ
jgi:integrase